VISGFPTEFIPAKAGTGMTKDAIHPRGKPRSTLLKESRYFPWLVS
jgi:hypothetical protein